MTPKDEKQNNDTAEMFKHIANFGGGPAKPMQMQWGMTDGVPNIWFAVGLTKREHIAAMVLQSIVERDLPHHDKYKVADEAIAYADALLERLKK